MEPFFRGFPYADEWGEKFASGSGACFPDPCFDDLFRFDGEIGHGYRSVLTDTWNPGSYDWWIILQMKPESDIDLNIRDCVLKHNAAWLYPQQPHLTPHNAIPAVRIAAEQTGRYRASNGQLMFVPTVNPKVTVEAYPGPYATFSDSFVLDYRSMPGLKRCSLEDACYTSKAMWEEGIVIALPETGTANANGHPCFLLKQGDQIRVHIEIPMGHPADIYYGPDNVSLKYIGICGTEFNSLVYPHCNPWNPELTPGCNDDQFQNCDEAFDICPTLTLQP